MLYKISNGRFERRDFEKIESNEQDLASHQADLEKSQNKTIGRIKIKKYQRKIEKSSKLDDLKQELSEIP